MDIIFVKGFKYVKNVESFNSFIRKRIKKEYVELPLSVELKISRDKIGCISTGILFVKGISKYKDSSDEFGARIVWLPNIKQYRGHLWSEKRRSQEGAEGRFKYALSEWDWLGFYFDLDEKNRIINIYGSEKGLNRFCDLLEDFVNESNLDHIHHGPYMNLTFCLCDKTYIDNEYIHGSNKNDFQILSNIVRNKLKNIKPGDTFIINNEYSKKNKWYLQFYLKNNSFNPALMDDLVKDNWNKYIKI